MIQGSITGNGKKYKGTFIAVLMSINSVCFREIKRTNGGFRSIKLLTIDHKTRNKVTMTYFFSSPPNDISKQTDSHSGITATAVF